MNAQNFIDIAIRFFALYGMACMTYVIATTARRRWTQFCDRLYTRGYNDNRDGLHNWRNH